MLNATTKKRPALLRYLFVAIISWSAGIPQVSFCQVPTYPQLAPIEESDKNPEFNIIKQKIVRACENKDSLTIYPLLFKNVQSSFGADGFGIKTFKTNWRISDSTSDFWTILLNILKMGCTYEIDNAKQLYMCPYTYSRFPEKISTSNHVVLYNKNVPIYQKPDSTSQVLKTVDYAILEAKAFKPKGWVKVTGFGVSDTGFIKGANFYSAGDPRIIFEKRKGQWGISAFISGD